MYAAMPIKYHKEFFNMIGSEYVDLKFFQNSLAAITIFFCFLPTEDLSRQINVHL